MELKPETQRAIRTDSAIQALIAAHDAAALCQRITYLLLAHAVPDDVTDSLVDCADSLAIISQSMIYEAYAQIIAEKYGEPWPDDRAADAVKYWRGLYDRVKASVDYYESQCKRGHGRGRRKGATA